MTSVSIVIPCYNAATSLAETIESGIAQGDVEILVIDDGSTDASLEIARNFEPRIRVLSQPNQGVSAARNKGIAECTGDWLIFLDADDWLMPGTIKARLETAQSSGGDVIISDWQEIVDDGHGALSEGSVKHLAWQAIDANPQIACATHVWATTAAIMYSRDLMERMGGFHSDLPIIQDARFLFDAAFHGGAFVHAPHIGAHYRVLPGSLSRRDPVQFALDCLLNGEQIEALWRGTAPLDAEHKAALAGIYDFAARRLLSLNDETYFRAVAAHHALHVAPSLHMRVMAPFAKAFGLKPAHLAAGLLGR